MGVDFYPCSNCGDTYCDCGDYITCNEDAGGCGRDWCSDDCAIEDGYEKEHCKKGYDVYYGEPDESDCEMDSCIECEYFVPDSCSYCRKELFEDSDLLEKALEMLGLTKEELIEKMKEDIN